jgi:putative salt-induced outer membrane protein
MFKILFAFLIINNALATDSVVKNESELSLIQTGGNSSVETYNLKTESNLKKEKKSYSFGGHYTLGSSEQTDTNGDKEKIESARNWDFHTRYEQDMSEKFSGFFGLQYEGDEFSGYKQRENIDLGAKYIITKTDKVNSFTELGARYTIERKVLRDDDNEDVFNYTKARLYYEFARKSSESFSYKFWAEYIPNFTESKDYLISFEPSINYVLSNTFSLKTAYKGVYDNEPALDAAKNRNEYLDYTFTTSIIAKF